MKEIEDNKPDVLCLQGVSDFKFFEGALAEIGLIGIFEPTKAAAHGEGCAIFVRADVLGIEKTYTVNGVGCAALVQVRCSVSTGLIPNTGAHTGRRGSWGDSSERMAP